VTLFFSFLCSQVSTYITTVDNNHQILRDKTEISPQDIYAQDKINTEEEEVVVVVVVVIVVVVVVVVVVVEFVMQELFFSQQLKKDTICQKPSSPNKNFKEENPLD
jgi:transposase